MNPYETLGVDKDASVEDINDAFKNKARKLHPDAVNNNGNVGNDGNVTFSDITTAVRLLRNPESRSRYDKTGETDDKAEENILSEPIAIIATILDGILDNIENMDDKNNTSCSPYSPVYGVDNDNKSLLDNCDIRDYIIRVLNGNMEKMEIDIKKLRRREENYKKTALRLIMRENPDDEACNDKLEEAVRCNPIKIMLRNRCEDMEKSRNSIEKTKNKHEIARDLIRDYYEYIAP